MPEFSQIYDSLRFMQRRTQRREGFWRCRAGERSGARSPGGPITISVMFSGAKEGKLVSVMDLLASRAWFSYLSSPLWKFWGCSMAFHFYFHLVYLLVFTVLFPGGSTRSAVNGAYRSMQRFP